MQNNSNTLWNAYNKFILNIYGKRVPIPYRINIPPVEHPMRRGKSSPNKIKKQLREDAKLANFDLNKASVEEINKFIIENKLGVDCSGFVYQILNSLLKTKGLTMRKIGYGRITRTGVTHLTSDNFTNTILGITNIQPGDLVKLDNSQKIPHILVVLETTPIKIIYAHSSLGGVGGVHTGEITITHSSLGIEKQLWSENFLIKNWSNGDGIRRLSVLF